MVARAALSALNHVLGGEAWARERLRLFAGQHLRLQGGPLAIELTVDSQGFLQRREPQAGETPAVTIELPADAPFRLLRGRDAVFGAARLTGSADFAETLAFVFRNLRWDIEEDLSRVVGDIVAHRLVHSGRSLLAWQRRSAANLAANVSEYLEEEAELLVSRQEGRDFAVTVAALAKEAEALEMRLKRL